MLTEARLRRERESQNLHSIYLERFRRMAKPKKSRPTHHYE